ncbi:MAG: arsenate reductase (glutaredoxin) [Rhodospirillales bacterium]
MRIYHNPRCSKSRQTLELIRERGIEPEIVEYLVSSPDASEISQLLSKLGLRARDLARKKESADAGLDLKSASDDDIVAAMAAQPAIIERPIVVDGDQAVLGRPPENVIALIEKK